MSEWIRVGRPGALGSRKQEVLANYDQLYGKDNWRLGWDVNGISVDVHGALALYEDAYFQHFQQYPGELHSIASNYANVYDNNPSNVDSGFDYSKQEFEGNHFQDIAIRRCLIREGLWFTGAGLLEIRMKGAGKLWSPSKIPFHKPELIQKQEIPGWWKPGSVESWYQSTKYLEVKDKVPFDTTGNLYFATTNSGKVQSALRSLGDEFKMVQIDNLAIAEEQQNVQEIAAHKARVSYAVLCKPVIVDDSGFVIPSQQGYPGIRVGRELKEKGLEHFLQIARNDARGYVDAYWEMAVGYFDDTLAKPQLFTSKVEGKLIGEQRGEKKDFIKSPLAYAFVVKDFPEEKTIAEMNEEEYKKYATTDRWKALGEFLKSSKGNI
ncbi:MAG: non-canonical purine NTP pyrophosphatase [Nanoarchaeota archaeon]